MKLVIQAAVVFGHRLACPLCEALPDHSRSEQQAIPTLESCRLERRVNIELTAITREKCKFTESAGRPIFNLSKPHQAIDMQTVVNLQFARNAVEDNFYFHAGSHSPGSLHLTQMC